MKPEPKRTSPAAIDAQTMDYAEGRTAGKSWNWYDGLIAQLAVLSAREAALAEKARQSEVQRRREVFDFVREVGLLALVSAYVTHEVKVWWYGADAHEELG